MKRIELLLLSFALFLTSAAWPQASSSTVRGTVRDQSQAAIPAAKVSLTNTATSIAREIQTNEVGVYVFPGVTPGAYRISVESPGVQRFEGTLTVQVQQDATVDMTMQVAQTTTSVEVRDVTPALRSDSASLGQVLERQRIETLPINSRLYSLLLVAVPGITGVGSRPDGTFSVARVRAYGLPNGSHTLTVDGAPMTEVYEGWDMGRQPGLDTVQEFRVEVNNSSAKFTRPTTIVMSSKSGTNEFHGALFETNRNSGYGTARQRQDYYEKPPFLNRNEFGFSAGAPIRIPKLYNGRNRTFWFFGWEAHRSITNQTVLRHVPTEAMRNGDFRGLVDNQGRSYTLYDPFTTDPVTWQRQPLAYRGVPNTIDPSRLSPTAKFLLEHTKMPTHPLVNPLIDANWIGAEPRVEINSTSNLRIDHRFSDKDLIYGRFSYGPRHQVYSGGNSQFLPIGGMKVIQTTDRWWPNHAIAATWVHTLSPTMTNELLLSGIRDSQRRGAGDGKTNYAAILGVPNPFSSINWPQVSDLGLGTYAVGGENPYTQISNFLTVQDNATKIVGKHELQFGFHYLFQDMPKSIDSLSGPFSAATLATAQYDRSSTASNPLATPFTGSNIANFYLGITNYTAQFSRPWIFLRRKEYAPYFQDNWKVTSRLTLNLGLRYEFRTPLRDRNDLMMSFDLEKRAYVLGTDLNNFIQRGATLASVVGRFQEFGGKIITHEQAGLPRELVFKNWKNFGPRLGFAYRALDGRRAFVVRGGYRLSYYTQPITNWIGSQSSNSLVSTTFQNSVTNAAQSPDGLPNYGLRSVPRYVVGANTPSSLIDTKDTRLLTRGFSAISIDPHLMDPRVHDWNFTVEKEVMPTVVVRVAYVGNHAAGTQQTVNINDQVPEYIWYATRRQSLPTGEFSGVARRPYDQQVYGAVGTYRSTGYTYHNGFQTELERRYHNGLAFQLFWVMGNTLVQSGSVADPAQFLPGTVPTDVNERNRFLNYQRDTEGAKHEIRWNWVADLPFGRGKKFGGNAHGVVEKLIGGWQIAGLGSWRTNYWTLPTSIYPTGTNLEIYGYKYPIEDCTTGTCYPGYLWWNGYIPSNRINSRDAQGQPNGIMGVPANYKPAAQPLIPWGTTALPANAPANTNVSSFWDTNNVWVPLNSGPAQRTTYDNGLHPWRNQYLLGPNQWFQDASLFKFVSLTERVTMRFNIDFFNVLNNPNNPTTIGSNGLLSTRNSGTLPRMTQLTLRLMW